MLSLLTRHICGRLNPRFAITSMGEASHVNPRFVNTSSSCSDRKLSSSSASSEMSVAFVGLGNMGLRMALNLAKSSADVYPIRLTVYDLNETNVSSFFRHFETMDGICDSTTASKDLAFLADTNPNFVIMSLPNGKASETVVDLILKGLPTFDPSFDGCTFIDTSTIAPNTAKKLNHLVTSVSPNNHFVDAPVSGGVKGATEGSLTFMVGCSSPETYSCVQPLLLRMGKNIVHCGGNGSGSAVKLCNNAALAAQMVGICEAMNLGEALGVDPSVLASVMNSSTAKCWSGEVNNPHPDVARHVGSGASANDYEGGFASDLMLKDLNLAVDAGEEEKLALPVAGLTRDLYRLASIHGYGQKDFGAMIQFLRGSR